MITWKESSVLANHVHNIVDDGDWRVREPRLVSFLIFWRIPASPQLRQNPPDKSDSTSRRVSFGVPASAKNRNMDINNIILWSIILTLTNTKVKEQEATDCSGASVDLQQ